MKFKKVEQLANNQFLIKFDKGEIFQSYDSIIAMKYYDSDILYLYKDYNYSITTSKYLKKCFGFSAKECTLALERKDKNFVYNENRGKY